MEKTWSDLPFPRRRRRTGWSPRIPRGRSAGLRTSGLAAFRSSRRRLPTCRGFPSSFPEPVPELRRSLPVTAAGQSRILTGFPLATRPWRKWHRRARTDHAGIVGLVGGGASTPIPALLRCQACPPGPRLSRHRLKKESPGSTCPPGPWHPPPLRLVPSSRRPCPSSPAWPGSHRILLPVRQVPALPSFREGTRSRRSPCIRPR